MTSGPDSSPESFPDILRTGSMLDRAAEILEDDPATIGPYRILERIGEGGMGIVYLAEQGPPLVRRVAIKMARAAVRDGRALARFESERQTLAAMNHPNIARVYDAGSASDARPYFVMEHVPGESITEFCEERQLGIEARLELFVRVCDGVQHAHVNAVIHRDLKPSNILVTTESGPATPKIIDFGVAKALGAGAGQASGLTQFGQIVGTPEYMSPEQAALDGRPVDTRTDVYALGVLLYELLAGSRPFERKQGRDTSVADLCRRIREDEPERPSTKASSTIARRLRGDLDAIALKALAKEPERRYATPADLAADVDNHLRHRPIGARRPGAFHRLGKTIRRHRAAAAVIATLSVALATFAVVSADQALKRRDDRARAEEQAKLASDTRRFLLRAIGSNGPVVTPARVVRLVETADRTVLRTAIREEFADQPVLLAQLEIAVAQDADDVDAMRESRGRIESLLGPDDPVTIAADEAFALKSSFAEGEPFLVSARERRIRLMGAEHPDTLRATSKLALFYKDKDRNDLAAPLFEEAIAGLEQARGPSDPDALVAKVGLSGSYLERRRYRDARFLLEGAIENIRRVFGDRDRQTRIALYNLAIAHAQLGEIEPGMRYLRASIEVGWNYPFGPGRDPLLLPLHRDPRFEDIVRAGRLNDWRTWPPALYDADQRLREGRYPETEQLLGHLLDAIKRVEGNKASDWADHAQWLLARCWIMQRRFDEAEALLDAMAARADTLSGDRRRHILDLLVQCDIGQGQRDSAQARLASVVDLLDDESRYMNVEGLYAQAEAAAVAGRERAALDLLAQASDLGLAEAERMDRDLAFARLRPSREFQAIAKVVRSRADVRLEP